MIRHDLSYEITNNAPVAQLDRVPGFEPGGREFESLRARHLRLTGHVVREARRPLGSDPILICPLTAVIGPDLVDERP